MTDDFDGTMLGAPWARDPAGPGDLVVNGGTLQIPAAPGDVYQTRNDARNLALRPAPTGPWTATTKLNFEGTTQYHQAGIMVYGTDDNFTKFGRIAHTTAGDEKFEFINEVNAVARNEAADSTAQPGRGVPRRLLAPPDVRRDQRRRPLLDRRLQLDRRRAPGRAAGEREDRPVRVLQRRRRQPDRRVRLVHAHDARIGRRGRRRTPSGPSYDDEFDGSSLDTDRWNAIVRPAMPR